MSGWNLTGRLVIAQFGELGNRIASIIANFDPETATQADRDQLADTLREAAQKLAVARGSYKKEHDDVVALENQIAADEKIFETLAQRLQSGQVTENAVNLFCDELEANKGRLPQERQEEAQAKEFMDQVQQIVDSLAQQLSDFDRAAKAALQKLAQANATKDLEEMRQHNQAQVAGLQGMKKNTTALDALAKRAEKVNNEAEGMKIVSAIAQKPIDDAAAVAELRKSVTAAPAESTLERLHRLAAEAKAG